MKFDQQLIRQYFREELMVKSHLFIKKYSMKGAKQGKLQTLTRLLSRRLWDNSDF